MHLIIKGSDLTITPSLLQYVEDKITRLGRLLPEGSPLPVSRVELARSSEHHRKGKIFYAEINLKLSGSVLLRAEAHGYDIRTAFDAARREVQQELRKFKGRRVVRARTGARRAKQRLRESLRA